MLTHNFRHRIGRNAAGWPARPKTIFDAAAHRRADRALDRLAHLKAYIERTATFTDKAEMFWDADSTAAYIILTTAWRAVIDANTAAQVAAKGRC